MIPLKNTSVKWVSWINYYYYYYLLVTKADVLYLYTKKAGGQNCRGGDLPGWRIDGDDWDARGDMREDIHFKGADIELGFWLITILCLMQASCNKSIHQADIRMLIWKIGLDRATRFWWAGFEANWRPSWKDHPKLGVCKQIILRGFRNRFRMQPICSLTQL